VSTPSDSPEPAPPGRLIALLRSSELKKWVKYSCVSLVGVVTTQVILSLPYHHWHSGTWRFTSVDANMLAVAISAVPAYLLNRAWVWGKRGSNSLTREVIPFWAFSFAGFLLSTLFVGIVERHTDATLAIRGANLAGFGLLWVARFFVLDKLLFKTSHQGEDTLTRLAEDAPLA
jgi:putative flippase GtrA